MTKQDVDVRVTQQENKCKLVYQRVYDKQDRRFAHYDMVEKLVHLELRDYRRGFRCSMCKTAHNQIPQEHAEWFEVSKETALAVVQRWRRWMVVNKPYNDRGQLTYYWAWKHHVLADQSTELADVNWDTWLSAPTLLERTQCVQYYTQKSFRWVWKKTVWMGEKGWISLLVFWTGIGVVCFFSRLDIALGIVMVVSIFRHWLVEHCNRSCK